jgi:hypothetical protein
MKVVRLAAAAQCANAQEGTAPSAQVHAEGFEQALRALRAACPLPFEKVPPLNGLCRVWRPPRRAIDFLISAASRAKPICCCATSIPDHNPFALPLRSIGRRPSCLRFTVTSRFQKQKGSDRLRPSPRRGASTSGAFEHLRSVCSCKQTVSRSHKGSFPVCSNWNSRYCPDSEARCPNFRIAVS